MASKSVYFSGQVTQIPIIGPPFANAINDLDQIVTQGGYLYSNGTYQNLNDLIDPSLGIQFQQANGINDAGYITAVGHAPSTTGLTGYLLIPTPEPASVALLGIGAFALILRRPRGPRD